MSQINNADLDSFLADAGASTPAAPSVTGPRRQRSQPVTLAARQPEPTTDAVPRTDAQPTSSVSTSSKPLARVGFLLMDPRADSEITDEAEAFIKKLAAGKFTTEQDFINGTSWLSTSTKTSKTAYRWFSQLKDSGLDVNLSHAVRWMTSSSVNIPLSSGNTMEIKKNVANLNVTNDDFEDIAKILIASAKASGATPTIWGDEDFTKYISNEMSKNGLRVKVIAIEVAAERGLTSAAPVKESTAASADSKTTQGDEPKIIVPDSYNPPRQRFTMT
ncbi:hypothetical protein D3C80_476140 [compost metagenome]